MATIMITEVYDALLDAGASEDHARKAAQAVAGFEHRFQRIEADLLVLKWMVGTVIVVSLGGFGTLIRMAGVH